MRDQGHPKDRNSSDMSEQIGMGDQGPSDPDDSDQFFLDDPVVFWIIMGGMLIALAGLIVCFALVMIG